MTRITYSTKSQGVVSPLPEDKKYTFQNANEVKTSVNALYDMQGQVVYRDSVHTQGSPQVLLANQDNIITIVDPSPNREVAPPVIGNSELWVGNKITPFKLYDSYVYRLGFTASINNTTGYFNIYTDINGLVGKIFGDNKNFPKGANVEHPFSFTSYIFCRDTFTTNGGNIVINPSHQMLIWDKTIVIHRLHGLD